MKQRLGHLYHLLAILLVMVGAILVLLGAINGTLSVFLNPRIVPRTVIGALGLLIVGLARPGSRGVGVRAVIPLLVPLMLLPAALRHDSAAYGAVRLFVPPRDPEPSVYVGPQNEEFLAAVAEVTRTAQPASGSDRSFMEPVNGVLQITDSAFDAMVTAIWDAPDMYAGQELAVTGFVYRRPEWKAEYYVVARMLLWCCAADAMVVGLLVDSGTSGMLPKDGEWISVTGPLIVTPELPLHDTTMRDVPTVKEPVWQSVSAPDSEYVFPALP